MTALKKATNITTDLQGKGNPAKVKSGASAMFSLSTIMGQIFEESKKELRFPHASKIYKQMLLDSSVATPYSLIEIMLSRPNWKVEAPKDAPEEEKLIARKLNYNIATMTRPWVEYIQEMVSYLIYGHWEGEKIFTKIDSPHGSFEGLKDILTISQDTVDSWIFEEDRSELIGLRQSLKHIQSTLKNKGLHGYVDIPKIKFLHLRNSPKRNNPEGRSVLNACYVDWKFKSVIEEYQAIGVTRDLGGVPVFIVDSEVLEKANADPSSWEAALINRLMDMGRSMHSGDLNCGIIPVAYDEKGNKLFDFKLQGIEGGGKQYNTLDIAKYHSNKILMVFFADVLSLGSGKGGSYALSDSKISLLNLAIESHLLTIARMLNHDLIRHIYQRNGWVYDPETSCKFVHDRIDDGDLEVFASAVQKILAVGGVRFSKELEDTILDKAFDLPGYNEDTQFLELQNNSRSGDGMQEGLSNGTGDSTSKGGDRSTANRSKSTV